MARSRNIKPGYFRNEILADLAPLTRLLFAGLWTVADRAGRLEDRPRRIKADVLPYDDGADVDAMLDALAERGFVARYKHGATRYIQIVNFDRHQNPHKNEAESVIPPMRADGEVTGSDLESDASTAPEIPTGARKSEEHRTSTVQAPESHSSNRADSLNTDSLNSDSLREDARARPGADAPRPPKAQEKHTSPRAVPIPDDFVLTPSLRLYAREKGLRDCEIDNEAGKFRDHYAGNGAVRVDWEAVWRNWVRRSLEFNHRGGNRDRASPNGIFHANDDETVDYTGGYADAVKTRLD